MADARHARAPNAYSTSSWYKLSFHCSRELPDARATVRMSHASRSFASPTANSSPS